MTAPNQKFGFVMFDDPSDPRDAWAADSGLPARRIQGVNELPTDTLWWTNVSHAAMFGPNSTVGSNPWLRQDAYLVVKPAAVLTEWGYDPATIGGDLASRVLSTVFGRVMMLALRLARECEPDLTPKTMFVSRKTLRSDIARIMPTGTFPTGEAAVVMKSGEAFQEYTKTTVRSPKNSKRIMLQRPRMTHAMDMLTTPVPHGEFEFKSMLDLRGMANDRVALLRSIERPAMVEITLQSINGDVAPVYAFGNSMDAGRRIQRSWVTHPEFVTMSSFADLGVRAAWLGESYGMLSSRIPAPVTKFLSDRFSEASWTAGVIAETLWRAVALPEERRRQQGGPPSADRPDTSWQGAWLKAADKTQMFLMAMKLTEMGYPASAYGLGTIWVSVAEEQVRDLVRDALSLGLYPRMADVPPDLLPPNATISWGGDKKGGMLAQLVVRRSRDELWNLDPLPLYEPSQRDAVVRQLAERRSARRPG